jgi:hypothetical protein
MTTIDELAAPPRAELDWKQNDPGLFQDDEITRVADGRCFDETVSRGHNFERIIGRSSAISALSKHIEVVAPTGSTVLILGETGTGKELIARAIHNLTNQLGSWRPKGCRSEARVGAHHADREDAKLGIARAQA